MNNINSMFYQGIKPWHRLGQHVENNLTSADAIKAAGLDWEVKRSTVEYSTNEGMKLDKNNAEKFNSVRGLSDTEYATARCVQHFTNARDKYAKKLHKEMKIENMEDSFFIGYGIAVHLHEDIEYFYHVSPTEIKAFSVTGGGPSKWKLVKTVKLATREAVS